MNAERGASVGSREARCVGPVLGLVCAIVAMTSGCYPTYAPPLRIGLGRLPEALGTGGGAVQVSTGYPPLAEGRLEIALGKVLDLDLGLYWMPIGVEGFGSLMGSLALHWEAVRSRFFRLRLTGGAGFGRGGEVWDYERDQRGRISFAGGGLVGLDHSYRINRHVGIYQGNRYHVSDSPETPVTHWGYHVIGVHTEVRGFYFALEFGIFYYVNTIDHLWGPTFFHLTVGYRWGPKAPTALKQALVPPPAPPVERLAPPAPRLAPPAPRLAPPAPKPTIPSVPP